MGIFAHFLIHFITVNCGDRGRANQADRDGKSGIEEHDLATNSRSLGVERKQKVKCPEVVVVCRLVVA